MTIEFQFTMDDYRNAFRTHFKKGASVFTRWMMKFSLAVGVFLLLVGILFLVTGQRAPNVMLPPIAIGALWIWIGVGGTYWLSARKQFARNPSLRQPRRVEINEAGVKTDAGIASSQQSWQAYVRYVESKDSFLLYSSPACFSIIPKRVLQEAQVNELRQMLNMNIGKKQAVAAV